MINRLSVVPASGPPAGTILTWTGPAGSGSVVFNGEGFYGFAQFPNEGPVGYTGQSIPS